MFKRLFILLALVAATASVSTPAHASTLAVEAYCLPAGWGSTECYASASGGTEYYTYEWTPAPFLAGDRSALFYCRRYWYNSYTVTVTDSSGATAYAEGWTYCEDPW